MPLCPLQTNSTISIATNVNASNENVDKSVAKKINKSKMKRKINLEKASHMWGYYALTVSTFFGMKVELRKILCQVKKCERNPK